MPLGRKGKKPEGALYCPGAHRLPRDGCTPVYCLTQRTGTGGKGRRNPQTEARKEAALKAGSAPLKDLGAVAPINTGAESLAHQHEGRHIEAIRASLASGKHAARRALVPAPEGLHGGDAEEYAQKKLVEMLPEAVANLEYDLKYGDDKQRSEASHKVLAANGMANREQAGNMVPPIVLNFTGVLPWMQVPGVSADTARKVKARAEIVDGEASGSKDGESGADGDGP